MAAISAVLAPDLWAEWVRFVLTSPGATPGGPSVPVPVWIRLPLAAALVIWGARTDRRWTVLVSAMIALPVLWLTGLSMLAGLAIELSDRRRREQAAATRAPTGVDDAPPALPSASPV